MKTVDFIRKFGWKYANHLTLKLKINDTFYLHDGNGEIEIAKLKKYTDAYELVESYGGWNNATALYDEYLDCELGKAITLVKEVGECDE